MILSDLPVSIQTEASELRLGVWNLEGISLLTCNPGSRPSRRSHYDFNRLVYIAYALESKQSLAFGSHSRPAGRGCQKTPSFALWNRFHSKEQVQNTFREPRSRVLRVADSITGLAKICWRTKDGRTNGGRKEGWKGGPGTESDGQPSGRWTGAAT